MGPGAAEGRPTLRAMDEGGSRECCDATGVGHCSILWRGWVGVHINRDTNKQASGRYEKGCMCGKNAPSPSSTLLLRRGRPCVTLSPYKTSRARTHSRAAEAPRRTLAQPGPAASRELPRSLCSARSRLQTRGREGLGGGWCAVASPGLSLSSSSLPPSHKFGGGARPAGRAPRLSSRPFCRRPSSRTACRPSPSAPRRRRRSRRSQPAARSGKVQRRGPLG